MLISSKSALPDNFLKSTLLLFPSFEVLLCESNAREGSSAMLLWQAWFLLDPPSYQGSDIRAAATGTVTGATAISSEEECPGIGGKESQAPLRTSRRPSSSSGLLAQKYRVWLFSLSNIGLVGRRRNSSLSSASFLILKGNQEKRRLGQRFFNRNQHFGGRRERGA